MRELVFTARFDRLSRRLPKAIRDAAYEKLAAYLDNPAHPSLRVKRIKGTDRIWEMTITTDCRLPFEVEGEGGIRRRIGTRRPASRPPRRPSPRSPAPRRACSRGRCTRPRTCRHRGRSGRALTD